MKRIISYLFVILSVSLAYGQENNTGKIKASYDYHFFDPRGIEKHHDFLLLASHDKSMFYNNHTQWLDSTRCTKDGEAWYTQTGMVLMGQVMGKPREEAEAIIESSGTGRSVTMYVVKEKGKFKIWDEVYHEYRKYSEDSEERNWNIVADSTKNILGYECILAESDYHGRHWKAWFAPEIPVDAGPWKLLGLPGLIMEAVDSTRQHHFTATGIESSDMPFPKVYEPFDYEKTTRKEFLALCRYRYDNFQGMRDLHFGTDAPKISQEKIDYETGKPGFDFLETDYR